MTAGDERAGPAAAADAGATGGGEPAARWEDYIDIFIAPAAVFRRRAGDAVQPPLVTLLLLGFVLYVVLIPVNRQLLAARIQADPQTAAFIEDYGTILHIIGALTVPVTMLAMVGFAALLLWGMAALVGVPLAPGRALLVATYAAFVLLIAQIASAALVLLQAGAPIDIHRDLSVGPLRFIDAGAAAVPWLRRFELFALWQAALWGVGVRFVAPTTATRAAAVAAATWLLFALPSFIFALLSPPPTLG